jgi:hypothetical protein
MRHFKIGQGVGDRRRRLELLESELRTMANGLADFDERSSALLDHCTGPLLKFLFA